MNDIRHKSRRKMSPSAIFKRIAFPALIWMITFAATYAALSVTLGLPYAREVITTVNIVVVVLVAMIILSMTSFSKGGE